MAKRLCISEFSFYLRARLSSKSLLWKSVFNHIEIRTIYRDNNFALRLALIKRLTWTQKWSNSKDLALGLAYYIPLNSQEMRLRKIVDIILFAPFKSHYGRWNTALCFPFRYVEFVNTMLFEKPKSYLFQAGLFQYLSFVPFMRLFVCLFVCFQLFLYVVLVLMSEIGKWFHAHAHTRARTHTLHCN